VSEEGRGEVSGYRESSALSFPRTRESRTGASPATQPAAHWSGWIPRVKPGNDIRATSPNPSLVRRGTIPLTKEDHRGLRKHHKTHWNPPSLLSEECWESPGLSGVVGVVIPANAGIQNWDFSSHSTCRRLVRLDSPGQAGE